MSRVILLNTTIVNDPDACSLRSCHIRKKLRLNLIAWLKVLFEKIAAIRKIAAIVKQPNPIGYILNK